MQTPPTSPSYTCPPPPPDPDELLPQLHYADGASAIVAALLRAERGVVYNVGDDRAMTRRAIADAARGAARFADAPPPIREDGAPAAASGHTTGRQLDSSLARRQLRWAPRYTSFRAFIDAEGSCECSEADEGGEYPPHPGGEYPSDWLLHTQGDARAEAREREISEIDELIALVAYEEGADFDGWPSPPPHPSPPPPTRRRLAVGCSRTIGVCSAVEIRPSHLNEASLTSPPPPPPPPPPPIPTPPDPPHQTHPSIWHITHACPLITSFSLLGPT